MFVRLRVKPSPLMRPLLARVLVLSVVAAAIAACETRPVSPTANVPALTSVTKVDGKGVPNGRSDSAAPFWQSPEPIVSKDPEYGISGTKPIRTGPVSSRGHILFLNALL